MYFTAFKVIIIMQFCALTMLICKGKTCTMVTAKSNHRRRKTDCWIVWKSVKNVLAQIQTETMNNKYVNFNFGAKFACLSILPVNHRGYENKLLPIEIT